MKLFIETDELEFKVKYGRPIINITFDNCETRTIELNRLNLIKIRDMINTVLGNK